MQRIFHTPEGVRDIYSQECSRKQKLQEKLQVTEKYKNMSITYEIEGSEQVLDGQTILSWLTINDDLSVTVDPDMAASYAQQLASKYNTYAATRSFVTTNGDTIKIGGGDYGWVIDKKGEAARIIEDIEKANQLQESRSMSRGLLWKVRMISAIHI